MKTYTIELTDTEDKALAYIASSQQDWIENVVQNRCRIAIDEIISLTVQKCLESAIALPVTKEEIVALAFEKGWVLEAKDVVHPEVE